ncbi:MAG: tail fiber domain-containing protein [Bacteroidetes bacterium]|nr:tail fiber domain-containing protein [Bacteroidota bacterium]
MKIKKVLFVATILLAANSIKGQSTIVSNTLSGATSTSTIEYLGSSNSYDVLFKSSGAERMRIVSTGNIGIGTTLPQRKLVVSNSAEGMELQPFTGYNQMISYNRSTLAYIPLVLQDASGGNVGIGVTAPLQKLDVNGDINIPTNKGFRINNSTILYNSGFRNIFLGGNIVYAGAGYDNNSFVGFNSGGAVSNSVCIGAYSGSGMTSGTATGNTFVGFQTCISGLAGNDNVLVGKNSGYWGCGGNNVCVGSSSGAGGIGSNNTYIGYGAGPNVPATLNTSCAIGYNSFVGASNCMALGGTGANAVNVGIGVSAPAYTLQVNGTAGKPGSGTWTVVSDKRLKKDISDFKDGLDVLKKINPVWFSYNGQAGITAKEKFVGVIAQEIQKVAPYTVGAFTYQDSLGNKTNYLSYDPNALIYIMVNSINEQQNLIEDKDKKIEELENRLDKQDAEMNEMKNTIRDIASSMDECCKISQQAVLIDGKNETPYLEQNNPNPFSETTVIKYYLPFNVGTSIVSLKDINGVELKRFTIVEKGKGQIVLTNGTLKSGTYIYDLIIEDKVIDSKKMVVVK